MERLQNATRKYWDKAALNSIGGDSFTYGQMATQIEKFHLAFEALGFKKGEKIALIGFGTFSVLDRKARTGHNPRTGKSIKIPAKKIVKFKPGAAFAKMK